MKKIKTQKMLDLINTASTLENDILVEARRNALELAKKEVDQILTIGRTQIRIQTKTLNNVTIRIE